MGEGSRHWGAIILPSLKHLHSIGADWSAARCSRPAVDLATPTVIRAWNTETCVPKASSLAQPPFSFQETEGSQRVGYGAGMTETCVGGTGVPSANAQTASNNSPSVFFFDTLFQSSHAWIYALQRGQNQLFLSLARTLTSSLTHSVGKQ